MELSRIFRETIVQRDVISLLPLFIEGQFGLHFFPLFLKENLGDTPVVELSHLEYILWNLQEHDHGKLKLEPGEIGLNPSVQSMLVQYSHPQLGIMPGPTLFWRKQGKTAFIPLDFQQTQFFEFLQHEGIHLKKNLQPWQQLMENWLQQGILKEPAEI